MAWSILFIAVLFFAVRGFFLGLPGVVAKLLGIVGGYICAMLYHQQLTDFIQTNIATSLPDIALKIISSAVLFFAAMLLISLLVAMTFKTLGKIIPLLQPLFDKQSLIGKLGGAVSNSLVAVAIVLTGIWGLSSFTGKNVAPEPLQSAANNLGTKLFDNFMKNKDFTFTTHRQTTFTDGSGNVQTSRGTATITSESNPEKTLNIETIRDTMATLEQVTQDPTIANKVGELMQNQNIQQLLNDPEIRDRALQQLKENPDEVKQLLENPELQQMLKQFNGMK